MLKFNQQLTNMAKEAQEASRFMLTVPSKLKNRILKDMALALYKHKNRILNANKKDLEMARHKGLSLALLDRLMLSDKRIREMSDTLLEVAKLPDPVGRVLKAWARPNGLKIQKVSVPIGVIAIIYESRPNVTADCIGLCFKSGNTVILKGGSEALNSNTSIYQALYGPLKKHGLAPGIINLITTRDRKAVGVLLKLNDYIDLVIPRGAEGLIRRVVETSRIPVIKHYKGVCHVYIDAWADLEIAEKICFNAKVQRPGVCNAMESMLVHRDIAVRFLPGMIKKFKDARVQVRGCALTRKIAKGAGIKKATENDYHTEYMDLILSVKVVNSLDEAIRHINYYGTHHSDAIVTRNCKNAKKFLKRVDSACVYVNASTRFTDGYQFGLGAEIGISTDKLHARGPMALEELTTYKYTILGNGQIRE